MLPAALEEKSKDYFKEHLLRQRIILESRCGNSINIAGQNVINFSSNDYLGISTDRRIKKAFITGVEKYGSGSVSSPLISGYYGIHKELEDQFAEFLNREKAILFNSGYLANLGVIANFADKKSVIFSDKLCHASIIDAILLSKAKHFRYAHNNVSHLMSRIKNITNHNKIIVSESVFSMSGNFAEINDIQKIANRNKALLIIDDAHGVGILGKNGAGICEHYKLSQEDIPVLITPLGKAFGCLGALVSGKDELIDSLIQFSRPYIYTTALPPAIAFMISKALEIIRKEVWRREKLNHLILFFIKQIKKYNLPLASEQITPIKSIIIGDNRFVMLLQEKLLKQGFLISAIRPPTVPFNTARIRISLNCLHTEKQVESLVQLLADVYEKSQG